MPKIVVIGDTHFRTKEPFFSAGRDFALWLIDHPLNHPDNYIIFLGDITHDSIIEGELNSFLLDIFNQLAFKEIYIIHGNHTWKRFRGRISSTTTVLENVPRLNLINYPCGFNIEGVDCLMLPHYLKETKDTVSMKECYEKMPFTDPHDFVFGHYNDETEQLFGNYIDTSHIQGEKILGHIHISGDHYLGSPIITRKDERGKENIILAIDIDTKDKKYIDVPRFLDYHSVNYGEDLPEVEATHPIWTIKEAPSREMALKKYPEAYVHEIAIKKDEKYLEYENISSEKKTIAEYLKEFLRSKKIKQGVTLKLVSTLEKRS
jgi:hypothetical protein